MNNFTLYRIHITYTPTAHLKILIIPVIERSEDTGLVYSLSVVQRAERLKFTMKDYFSSKKQRAITEKLILAIPGQKKIDETNKKWHEKVCEQDKINDECLMNSFHFVNIL